MKKDKKKSNQLKTEAKHNMINEKNKKSCISFNNRKEILQPPGGRIAIS
jgi:hypothetical protein